MSDQQSSDTKPENTGKGTSGSMVVRWLLIGIGWISVVLGVAGIFLPLLPTTPFLLLAAGCFYRSSPKFHAWLINHPKLSKYLVYYLNGEGMPAKAKFYTITLIWVTMLTSAFILLEATAPKFILPVIGCLVTLYILRLPTLDVSKDSSDKPS